jgi:tetratricopeptide (TPR) repeat protein
VISAVTRRLDSPLIGRVRQMLQLRQAFEAAEGDSACQLFTLLGPAGVGKSRVVEEFVGEIGERATVLRGRCLPYGEGITYFPVVETVKQAAGLADFDLPDVIEAKVCSVLEGDEHQQLVCRHVSQLMGLEGSVAGEETFWAIRRFFEAAARERPLVLVLDDIHWGEPTFLDLVEHIADWSRGSPILLLCMARPDLLEARAAWGGGKMNASTVSLEPLSGEQARSLIANLLGSEELAAEVADRIVVTAEGNPLFVEETLAMLIDEGTVVRRDDRWVAAGDLSEVTVPPSIQALLAARLDHLAPDERTVLEAAAVMGKEFFVGAARALVDDDLRARVPNLLMSLVRKELIRPDRTTLPGEDAFVFRNLLIRDSAYEAIPKAQRAELHERFADWLERTGGDAIAEQEEIVAYHLEQALAYRLQLGPADERSAALGVRASSRLASASRRASVRGDHPAAAKLLRRALAATPPDAAERPTLLYDLGDTLEWIGEVRESSVMLTEAEEAARAAGDARLERLAQIRHADVLTQVDPHAKPTEEIRAELAASVEAFERLGDDAALAIVWAGLARIEWMPCRYETAERAGRRALDHARRSGDERLLASAITPLIAAQMFGSATPEEGIRSLDQLAGDLARSRQGEAFGLVVRGAYRAMEGEFDEARRLIGQAAEIAEALGLSVAAAGSDEVLGSVETWAGDLAAAERAFRRHFDELDRLGDEGHKSTAAANLARTLVGLDRHDEAERYAVLAREIAAEDDLASQVAGRSAQALVLAARGRSDEGVALAREAVDLYRAAGAECPNFVGDAWMDLAKVCRLAGDPAGAVDAAREAVVLYETKGNRPASASTRAFIEDVGSAT